MEKPQGHLQSSSLVGSITKHINTHVYVQWISLNHFYSLHYCQTNQFHRATGCITRMIWQDCSNFQSIISIESCKNNCRIYQRLLPAKSKDLNTSEEYQKITYSISLASGHCFCSSLIWSDVYAYIIQWLTKLSQCLIILGRWTWCEVMT